MVELHGVMSVAQMPQLYRHQWSDMLSTRGAKPGWVDTFMRILNTEFPIMSHERFAVPESALKQPELQLSNQKTQFKDPRFRNQMPNLGAVLRAAGKLDDLELPAAVLEAPTECPDPAAFKLTYNDVKAVTKEIFLWVMKEFQTVYIDKTFALQVEKLLLAAKFRHHKDQRWWMVILARFENGRRSHAKVRCSESNPLARRFCLDRA